MPVSYTCRHESSYQGACQAGNNHHMIEAMFKAFARALDEATGIDEPRITGYFIDKRKFIGETYFYGI